MKKTIPIIYGVMLTIGVIMILIGTFGGKENAVSMISSTEKSEIFPEEISPVTEDITEYYFTLSYAEEMSPCMEFFTNHQLVEVYADDTLVYELMPGKFSLGNTTGSVSNFVQLPANTNQVKVVLEAAYPQVRDREYQFFLGDGLTMLREFLARSIPNMIISILNITLGIVIMVYWIVMRRKTMLKPGVFYFGIFTTMVGFWTLTETDFVNVFLKDHTAGSFNAYITLMLLTIPFTLFLRDSMEIEDRYFSKLICTASFLNILVCTGCHIAGIWEFKQSAIVTHLVMMTTAGYMIYGVYYRIQKKGFDRKVRANLIGAAILTVTLAVDLIAFYTGAEQTDIIGRLGLLIYIVVLGAENVHEFFVQIEEGRKVELYKELAITDILTGLYNRNAFDEWEAEQKDFSNIMLVTFDLNNLKWCNDTLGHAAGDKYITDAANIIKRVFGDIGVCYRIGGDEFCAVIKECDKVDVQKRFERLKTLQKQYNQHSSDVNMQIAYGHAVFGEADATIEETRSRADIRMYQNKRKSKKR